MTNIFIECICLHKANNRNGDYNNSKSYSFINKRLYLSDVHSARGLKPIVADRFGIVREQISQLLFTNTLLSYAHRNLVLLLQTHTASINSPTNKQIRFLCVSVHIENFNQANFARDSNRLLGFEELEASSCARM
jgi:transposase